MQEDESGWRNYLRVQIHMDLTQPLARGRTLSVKGNTIWVPFSYEKCQESAFRVALFIMGLMAAMEGGVLKEKRITMVNG